jgi:hypothetical protein
MPELFDKCRAEGGKIRTQQLAGGKYVHICTDASGKQHRGYVKTRKTKKKWDSNL